MIAYCRNTCNVPSSESTDYKPHLLTEGESDTMNCQDAITWLHRKGTRQPMTVGQVLTCLPLHYGRHKTIAYEGKKLTNR